MMGRLGHGYVADHSRQVTSSTALDPARNIGYSGSRLE
jgi:hypothetical protein